MRLALYLPQEVHQEIRIRAIKEGTSTTKLVERLIREYLDKAQPKKRG